MVTRRDREESKGVGSGTVRRLKVANFQTQCTNLSASMLKQKERQDKPSMRYRETRPLTECIVKSVQPPLCLGISAMLSSHGQVDLLPRSTVVGRFGPHYDSGYSQKSKGWHVRTLGQLGFLATPGSTCTDVPRGQSCCKCRRNMATINFHVGKNAKEYAYSRYLCLMVTDATGKNAPK